MSDLEASFGSSLGSDEFHKSYLKPLLADSATTTAVIFLQDKLHSDDFTQYADVYNIDSQGGAFSNIKSLMEDNFSLEVPRVNSPLGSLEKLQAEFQGNIHTVNSLEEVESIQLQPTTAVLLIVRLEPTDSRVDKEAAIQRNDEMIGKVCKHLNKRSIKYVAAFTGEAASQDFATTMEESHSSRHLLATTATSNGTLMNITSPTGSSFLFMKDIYICIKNGGLDCVANFSLVPTPKSAVSSTVTNTSATINIVFDNATFSGANYNIKIVQQAIDQGDRWVITRTALYVTPSDVSRNNSNIENGTLSPGEMDFVVPILYSFHCTQMKMYIDNLKENFGSFKGTYVTFNGYQFQPFKVQQDRFFMAVDCVGFFTTAIWMGLFPVAILLIILLYGTLMLLDLSIMDRYDDPKGKTISVNAGGSAD